MIGDPTIAAEADRIGAEFVQWQQAPHRRSAALADDVLKDWECRTPVGLFRRVSERLVTGPAAAYAQETAAAVRRRRPDVALVDGAILGPMVATEALGVPTVGICPGFYLLPARGMPPLGFGFAPAQGPLGRLRDTTINVAIRWAWRSGLPALNAARQSYSLAPLTDPWDQLRSCHTVLVTTVRAYDFPADLPSNVHYAGPILDDPIWAASTDASPAPAAAAKDEGRDQQRPLVVVGFSGSYVAGQDDVLRRTARALTALPVRGLVCTGPYVDPSQVPGSPNVQIVRSAPHTEVFPRASVVVNHGGHGTVTKALAAGKPVLCLPKFRDQKDNAIRMTTRGAGLSLTWRAGERDIVAALRRLLSETEFTSAAVALGRRIRAEMNEDHLVELLERPAGMRESA